MSFSSKKNTLFNGDDFLFKKSIEDIKIYGEYGCGQSSTWMLKNTSSLVISVDTSKEWVDKNKKAEASPDCLGGSKKEAE